MLTGTVSEETVVEAMKRAQRVNLLKDRMTRLGPAIRRAIEERTMRVDKARAEANTLLERTLKEALKPGNRGTAGAKRAQPHDHQDGH